MVKKPSHFQISCSSAVRVSKIEVWADPQTIDLRSRRDFPSEIPLLIFQHAYGLKGRRILSASAHTAGLFWAYSCDSLGWSLLGTFRALWGAIGTLLGHFGYPLGRSWEALGRS